jgi:hypothetical protein
MPLGIKAQGERASGACSALAQPPPAGTIGFMAERRRDESSR